MTGTLDGEIWWLFLGLAVLIFWQAACFDIAKERKAPNDQ